MRLFSCNSHPDPPLPTPSTPHQQRSAEEVARFTALAREEGILAKIQASIAPKIFGAQDIKKAVACLLFGGCRKVGGACFGHVSLDGCH